MFPKRIAYIADVGEESVLADALAYFVCAGKITYDFYTHVPDPLVIEQYDGFIVLGMGDCNWPEDRFFADLKRTPPGIPGIYVYTIQRPNLPLIEAIEAPFRFDKFIPFFEKAFALSRIG